jgi:sec-independent protein translocase protein TatA
MPGHWWVLLLLAIVALIIFGPRRLPELGEGLGRAIREFRKASSDVGQSLRDEVDRTRSAATGTTYTYTGTATPTEPPAPPAEQPRS